MTPATGPSPLTSRQGDAVLGWIPLLIVALLVVVAGVLVFKIELMGFFSSAEKLDCAQQVYGNAYMSTLTGEKSNPEITCPTRLITNHDKEETSVKKVLAQEMKRCWDTWGKGELRLFGGEEGYFCHVCSMITVDGVQQVTGLPQYLDTAKATRDDSYSEYLVGKTFGEQFKDKPPAALTESKLPTKTPIGIIFVQAKGLSAMQRLSNFIIGHTVVDTAAGAAGGGAAAYGLIAVGTSVTGTGIGFLPGAAIIGTGVVAGAAGGLLLSVYGTTLPDYQSYIVVRPLTETSIAELGCAYAPAKS